MAQKKRKPNEEFFEALAASQWTLPAAKPVLPVDSDDRGQAWGSLKDLMLAAAQDLRHYCGQTSLRLTRNRNIYKLAAAGSLAASIGLAAMIGTQTLTTYASALANPNILLNHKNTGTTILDRNGEVLYRTYGATGRQMVELKDLPPDLIKATLTAEDPGFYQHPAFSWRATARALYNDITHRGKVEGGSTITQQLIKNTLLTPEKSFKRKFDELVLATQLERHYSKDQILTMYFNQVNYGQGAQGVEAAAQTYFRKPARNLTLAEGALLAGLPLGPTRFDPNFQPEAALARRNFILEQMRDRGLISPEQAAAAQAAPVAAFAQVNPIRAPHFVFYALDQLRQQYGEDLVEHGGITVRTTLDITKQDIAQEEVRQQISRLQYQHVTNAGLVSLEPKTGDILAMVGSIDYFEPHFGRVNVTLSQLQPGSSFKPIAYATAFKKDWHGAIRVDDKPLSLPAGDGTMYKPQNDDGKFRGPVLLRRALANSLNVPAIQVLRYAGIHDTIATAHDLGITTLNDENRYGLSLVLGGGEVRPLDLATVYATLANQGSKVSPRAIMEVRDRYGSDITKKVKTSHTQVLDPRLAYMITSILSDNNARQEIFGVGPPLTLSVGPAAVKTGTTNDFRDNWTVGYTPDLVAAVWSGNNDHSPMRGVHGFTGAAPIWHNYMERVLSGAPKWQFIEPPGMKHAKVCAGDGGLANPWDKAIDEIFLAENVPTKKCASSAPKPPEEKKDEPKEERHPAEELKPPAEPQTSDEIPPAPEPADRPRPRHGALPL
jgi:1A family penicillin-binding protein